MAPSKRVKHSKKASDRKGQSDNLSSQQSSIGRPRRPSLYKLTAGLSRISSGIQSPPSTSERSTSSHSTTSPSTSKLNWAGTGSQIGASATAGASTNAGTSAGPGPGAPPGAAILGNPSIGGSVGGGGGTKGGSIGGSMGGPAGAGSQSSQYGGKHVHDLFLVLKDYMNKCDL